MAVLLNNSPSGTQATQATGNEVQPGPGEQYASPYEEQLLKKTMAAFYQSINDPKKIRMIESWLLQGANHLGVTIGQIVYKILFSIYMSAKKAGVVLPDSVFFAQGGAVYQAIDRMLAIAEHAGVPNIDQDKAREDALGIVVDSVRRDEGQIKGQGASQGNPSQDSGAPQGAPVPQGHVMAANPLSHAVGQGLQQQGLMGGGQ